MRCGDVPLAEFGGFVLIEAVMHAQGNFVALQHVGEVQVGGRVVGRIAAEDDQQIDLAACMSATSSFSDSVWLTGFASTGSV